jgi:tripartite-type tricarboxylate transporter receptor subunit TctC
LMVAPAASAQNWVPSKPVRLIVPYPAGGTSDMIARLIAPGLGEALGQPVVVENRSGGGGVTGTEVMLRSPADGHTFGIVASSHASGATLVKNLPYDPIKDVQPLTLVTRVAVALVVNPAYAAKSMQDVLAMARAKPGTIPYGSAGNGLSGHFAGEAMKIEAKIDMVHVPYRGGVPGLNDVMGGQIPMMFNTVSSVLPAVEGGRVRALVVTGKDRVPVLPNVPTMAEVGLPSVEIYEWYGLVAPAGVSPEIARRLYSESVKVLNRPELKERLAKQGIEVATMTPEEFGAFLKSEVERFREIVQKANITSD